MTIRKVAPTPGLRKGSKPGESYTPSHPCSTRPEGDPGPSADNAGAASPAGGEDGRGSAAPASSLAANSARTPDGCPSCAVLSRQYGLVIEQNAALAARNRALEIQVGRLLTSADTLRAALRDLHAAGGGE